MKIIWIGDQRSKQIKYWQEADEAQRNSKKGETEEQPAYDLEYILNDQADNSWFSTIASKKALNFVDTDTAIIVSLGLNDCINSGLWKSFSIKSIAADYVKILKELAVYDSNCRVYFCTVTPVNADIPRSEASNGLLAKKIVNNNIITFNDYIKSNSNNEYSCIDCYYYVNETSYATRDGLLYTAETSQYILNYILNNLKTTTVKFPARLDDSNPLVFNDINADTATGEFCEINETSKFYIPIALDGLNIFTAASEGAIPFDGCVLPNCTAYAWGRFYEITGETPKVHPGNAETWFGYKLVCSDSKKDDNGNLVLTDDAYKKMVDNGESKDGYKRGKEPQEGAIICWEGVGGEAGHVAIVEKVTTNSDGTVSIITSESGAGQTDKYWWTTPRDNLNGNWGANNKKYRFQGFIYCPVVTPTATAINVEKKEVISKAGSLEQPEMEINAKYIWSKLGNPPKNWEDDYKAEPWTLNAVAGILGNMQMESSINPGRQEKHGSGFGLLQWTPAKDTLFPWCDERGLAHDDIDAQLGRLLFEKMKKLEYYKDHYKYTFDEFTKSTDSAYELACAFAFDYERPAVVLCGFHRGIKGDPGFKYSTYHVVPPHKTKSRPKGRPYCSKEAYDNECETKCKGYKWCYLQKFGKARTEQQMEKNRQDLRDMRGGAAEKWFKFLLPYAPGSSYFEEKFIVENLKIDKCTTTSITASFITSNAKSGVAKLYDPVSDSKKLKDSKTLSVIAEKEDENVIISSFKFSDLSPNTKYKLVIEVNSNLENEKLTNTLEFTTPQSYPKTVEGVYLNFDSTTNEFIVSWSKLSDSDWGYWKDKDCKYILYFFKNGQQIDKEISKESSENTHTFKLTDISNTFKLDDIIQVGIRTRVKKDIYDNEFPTTSEGFKFLKQPIKTYLNVK